MKARVREGVLALARAEAGKGAKKKIFMGSLQFSCLENNKKHSAGKMNSTQCVIYLTFSNLMFQLASHKCSKLEYSLTIRPVWYISINL